MGNLCPFARIGDFKGSPGNWVVGKGGGMELVVGKGVVWSWVVGMVMELQSRCS